MTPNIDAVTALIRDVAADEIVPRFRNLAAHDVLEKRVGDLVTAADTGAERALTERLSDILPGSRVVGEEGVADDPTLLGRLEEPGPVWVVDPLDGTVNFAGGLPIFAVMVALVEQGRTVAGWIHDPVHDMTATAALGQGAWLGDTRVTLNAPDELGRMSGALHTRFGDRDRAAHLARRSSALASALDLHCAGMEYLGLLLGRLHFAVYPRAYPWDHLAGALLIAEAGGHVARTDGRPYEATGRTTAAPLLVAANETCWQTVRREFF